VQLAARLYFLRHPPHPALNNLGFGWESEALPRWWSAVGPALPPAAVVAQGIATAVQRGVAALPADLDLPDLDVAGKWELAIAQAAPITSADHAEALLHFLDGGPVSSPKPVRPAAAVALRAWVAATERGERVGREVARALSLRVGSPFGGEAAGRWVAVPELLPKVRAWLAGEVLEVVFEHLRPTIAGHQLAARKAFWKGYTGRVLRVWVAVSDNIKKRKALDHPDVRKIREAMGPDLKVMDLEGGAEQALVWMHLQGRDGLIVTVIEGNANTTLRMRQGSFEPRFGYVDYRQEVMSGEVGAGGASSASITHNGRWADRAEEFLAWRGIVPA
jgi:hypothetical protein